ncbi:hypothetical protein [Phytoactinopolyspora limicola]|uniref:hypothetical protein n=1 Tax=Phytoactinopolyspora limicola TaxID=2715536 RepID=UPI00140A13CB|nr:hypothetical protein [Phytoactinopolyspora limicola]
MSADDAILAARALVLRDLNTRGIDSAAAVNVLDDAVTARRWWVEQWPAGAAYVAGQVAQDVQERLLDGGLGRWPLCTTCADATPHELRIDPDLGPDPHWVCVKGGIVVAALAPWARAPTPPPPVIVAVFASL